MSGCVDKTFIVGITPAAIAITPDDKFAYVADSNNYGIPGSDTVTVLNLETSLKQLNISDPSFNEPYRIAIDRAGKYAYVCNSGSPSKVGQEGTVSIINTRTNTVSGVITGFDGPGGIALSKSKAYVTNYGASGGVHSGNGKTISVVDLQTRKITNTIEVDQGPAAIALSACSRLLYVICYVDGNPGTGTLQVIQRKTNTIIATIKGFFGPFGIALTKCCSYAYVTNFGSNNFTPYGTTVSLVDLKKYKILKNIEVGIQPSGIAISDNYLYISNYNALYAHPDADLTYGEGTINIICLKKNIVVAPVIPIGETPSTITLSPNKKTLYVCNYSQNVVRAISLCP
ncbi:MAG: hypothetical protein Hyperionvirus32_6 [Hyperionvirus sp.]|uniref:YncE family protein n=1 Tax=Hyperionvirus sp. TaxID=2487770 RepID=A0A3G5AGV6_9VIRU|nr:MAG: hypothetical protein Hyperionvirus32_6 [Hyperionvirus sp.]